MSELKIGDVVSLKSGGPKMTIDQLGEVSMTGDGAKHAWVSWFDSKNAPQKGMYPVTSLEIYVKPAAPRVRARR